MTSAGAVEAGGVKPEIQSFQIPIGKGATAVLNLPVPLPDSSFKIVREWLRLMEPATESGERSSDGDAD